MEDAPAGAWRWSPARGEEMITGPEALRGKVVLVTFWATTCPPCTKQMPGFVETHNRLRERGNETLAVAMSHDRPGAG